MTIPIDQIRSLQELCGFVDHAPPDFQLLDLDIALKALERRVPEARTVAGQQWLDETAAGAMLLVEEGGEDIWDTDYGPIQHKLGPDGQAIPYPDLNSLRTESLDHWRKRSSQCRNPVFKARYADLAWTFAKILQGKPDVSDARTAIEAYMTSMNFLPDSHDVIAIQCGHRAMVVALKLSDSSLQSGVKLELFALAKRLEIVPLPLRRSFLMAWFGLGAFSKVQLSEEEQDYMVWLLEDRLAHECSMADATASNSIWDAENAAQLLVRYYRKIQRTDGLRRVLESYGDLVHRRSQHAAPLAGQAWLESFARLCEDHGQKDLSSSALLEIQALGPRLVQSLKRVESTVQIPETQIEAYIAQFVEGDLDRALGTMACVMVPDLEEVDTAMKEMAGQAVFISLARRTLVDGIGRPLVQLPSFIESPKAHLPLSYSQWIRSESFFRFSVLKAIRTKYDPSAIDFVDWLFKSPLFHPSLRPLLERGFDAYLTGDFIPAIHILIPQLEDAARRLSGILGDSILEWKKGDDGVEYRNARSLNSVLDSPSVEGILGVNRTTFLRVSLVKHQGLNLRNRVAHGLMLPDEYTASATEVVVQCLLILGLVRNAEMPES